MRSSSGPLSRRRVAGEVALACSDSAARARARTGRGWWRRRAGSASGRSPCAGRARWRRGRPPAAGAAPRAPGAGTRRARRGRGRRDGRGSPRPASGPRRRRPARRRRSCDAARGRAARPPARRRGGSPATLWMRVTSMASRPRERRQDRRAAAARASSCPRRAAREQQVVSPRGGDGQRLDDVGVAADVGEVEVARRRGEHVLVDRRAAVGARRRAGSRPPARGCWPRARRSPSTSAASRRALAREHEPAVPARAAPSATASAPRHGRISPPSPSSPKTA